MEDSSEKQKSRIALEFCDDPDESGLLSATARSNDWTCRFKLSTAEAASLKGQLNASTEPDVIVLKFISSLYRNGYKVEFEWHKQVF